MQKADSRSRSFGALEYFARRPPPVGDEDIVEVVAGDVAALAPDVEQVFDGQAFGVVEIAQGVTDAGDAYAGHALVEQASSVHAHRAEALD